MDRYLPLFSQAVDRIRPLLDANRIEPCVGLWHDSAVLRLQKDRWAGATSATGAAESGIFFSIWIDAKALKRNRAFYNIHALKLRALPGYSIASRDFAAAFRARFSASSNDWPHVSNNFGPQTLIQGWIELGVPAHFVWDVDRLIRQFVKVHGIIDTLLTACRKQPGS